LHPTIIGRVRDGPTHFDTGGFLLCRCIHQTAAFALFLWGIWERETVTKSVASDMHYIMARFFDCAGIPTADAQNTIPHSIHCTLFTGRFETVQHWTEINFIIALELSAKGISYVVRAFYVLNPTIWKGSKQ